MDRQPKYWVKKPPANGPNAKPRYTAETDMPSTLPRYCGKNAETKMAGPVVLEKAAPIPCINRNKMSQKPEGANPQTTDDTVKIEIPILNIRRIPVKSPQRPTGSKNMAVASKKEVITQLNVTAFNPKLFSIAGKAIFTDEIKKVPINEVMATMAKMEICFFVQCIKIILVPSRRGQN
jgi:hypothetical protein